MNFEMPTEINREADDFVISKTRQYNAQFVPHDFAPLSVYCRDEDNSIIGGLTGKTYWNYLDIEFLWVDKQSRKHGVATQLLSLAEAEAKRRNCHFSMLDTYEFQALEFYLKQGYEQFGRLEGYCDKYHRYYLKKVL